MFILTSADSSTLPMLLNTDQCSAIYALHNEIRADTNGITNKLGTYETEERAQEVLMEITVRLVRKGDPLFMDMEPAQALLHLNGLETLDNLFVMPKE